MRSFTAAVLVLALLAAPLACQASSQGVNVLLSCEIACSPNRMPQSMEPGIGVCSLVLARQSCTKLIAWADMMNVSGLVQDVS